MSTEDERRELVSNTILLSPRCEADSLIPTEIYVIDVKMWELERVIREMGERRARLLERAIAFDIMKDGEHEIVKKEKNLPRRINMQEFEAKLPEAFKLACTIEVNERLRKAQEMMDDATKITNIKIATAQALLQERMVDEICYPHKVAVTYEVQKCRSSKRSKLMP
jgi:hypothetical protein